MKSALSKLLALIIGGTIGLAVGILFAPHKGTVTRAKIKSKMDEKKELAEEKALKAQARAKKYKKDSWQQFSDKLNNLRKS